MELYRTNGASISHGKEDEDNVKSDTPGDTSDGEVRQQRHTELPVHLL